MGGLGNQMFQFAFLSYLMNFDPNVKADLSFYYSYQMHDGFELDKIFSIKVIRSNTLENYIYGEGYYFDIFSRLRRKVIGNYGSFYSESELDSYEGILVKREIVYYNGYWQNLKYIDNQKQFLKERFNFPELTDSQSISLSIKMLACQSVAIHVRRGDYVGHPILGNVCDEEYYRRCLTYVEANVELPKFFVFSNDLQWCQDLFRDIDVVYVDLKLPGQNYIDMQLMSVCKHNIIANSSFSWWAAWLNGNSNKIVCCPQVWDLKTRSQADHFIPSSWVRI